MTGSPARISYRTFPQKLKILTLTSHYILSLMEIYKFNTSVKIKQSCYRPWRAQTVPGS
jgi:hypothetical protein